jgi:type I restriction-modification system DNA methylase subunit
VTSLFRPGPLFHVRVHPRQIAAFAFPEDLDRRHAIVLGFVDALKRGRLDDKKEVSLHGDFLTRVFGDALGYRTVTQSGAEGWELTAEQRMGAGGKSVDGALGFFREGEVDRVLVPIELKSVRQDLDRSGGRALTPVQQAWDYANHSPGCRFIIVSNYKETRLYSTARTPDVCETFLLEDLATLEGFKRFYYLLARERLLGPAPGIASSVELLLASSAAAEAEVTSELYKEYRGLREKLFAQLRLTHSNLPALEVLGYAQTILDRVLFVAFAEDRDLLPRNTLTDALAHRDKYDPKPLWNNLKTVFGWIDRGNSDQHVPAYNGGLFRKMPQLDQLEVSDELCKDLAQLARYDFRDDISVEVLGHVFEQSISDLEALRRGAEGTADESGKLSKRHDEGVYYTPAYITRYIVDRTLGRMLIERRTAVFDRIKPEEKKAKAAQTAASIDAWKAYREELKSIRVIDPACGSGAFLVAAYDALGREYERINAELVDLRGGAQIELFDLEKAVLNNNLFGVDLNSESVEITRLSLWLKTAQYGRRLTYLDSNIKWGDSIVKDPDLSRVAFDWARGQMARSFLDPSTDVDAVAIDARWREGFDVVIGNPPYIRHELFTHLKEHLGKSYIAYSGMADIYVYFFERGLSVLKPHGRLGFIVANKWLRAGYAAPLRQLLAKRTLVDTLVDFGHAPIFEDADAFPCVIALRKLAEGEEVAANHELSVTAFPRSELEKIEIAEYVASHQYAVPQKRLTEEAWSLEPEIAESLYRKIKAAGIPLVAYAETKPYRGILTGYNDAFFVDDLTRDRLIEEDARSGELLKKCLRGSDVDRWGFGWGGTWLICARRGIDIENYPAILRHLSGFRQGLEPRPRDNKDREWPGRKSGSYKWYELQDAVDYWDRFAEPKLIYQVLQFHPCFAYDDAGFVMNDKGFFIPVANFWLLAVLNSPLMWWHNWRYLGHMKDEALTPLGEKMEQLPIAAPNDESRRLAEEYVPQLVTFVKEDNETRAGVLDALATQMSIAAPGQKLQAFETLSRDEFLAEVTKRRPKTAGKLKPADLKYLREIYDESAVPIQDHRRRALAMEKRLADLVNRAYGLTPDDIELLWSTAPPRMPVGR